MELPIVLLVIVAFVGGLNFLFNILEGNRDGE